MVQPIIPLQIAESWKSELNIFIIPLKENTGFAHANNVGIDYSADDSNRYIVTLNNDIELDPKCLSELALFNKR